jgi:hypothetical protein
MQTWKKLKKSQVTPFFGTNLETLFESTIVTLATIEEPIRGVEARIPTISIVIKKEHHDANVDKVIIELANVVVTNIAPKNVTTQLAILEEH